MDEFHLLSREIRREAAEKERTFPQARPVPAGELLAISLEICRLVPLSCPLKRGPESVNEEAKL